jgi:hypothetical protein
LYQRRLGRLVANPTLNLGCGRVEKAEDGGKPENLSYKRESW